jgi:hypothetical protein
MTTATITVHDDGTPSAYYPPSEQADNGAMDYSVTIVVSGSTHAGVEPATIEGSITLYRDVANSGMSPCGTPIDGWCSGEIVTWLRTLDARAYKTAVATLAAGVGSEDVSL